MKPDRLLREYRHLLDPETLTGPVLDLACGEGGNGIFLAEGGLSVVLADKSARKLQLAKETASTLQVRVATERRDLEQEGHNPLEEDRFGAVLVFRYLHRPLIPCIKKALRSGGILIYETFTLSQAEFGRPRNPDFLLAPGELRSWFRDWEIIHDFEGTVEDPRRAVAQIVCRKPPAPIVH